MKRLGAALACLGFASVAHAGPDATIQFLMDDEASMFDIGMLRMNLILAERDLGRANYFWAENRIEISPPVDLLLAEYGSADQAEAACAAWATKVRSVAGLDSADGLPYGVNSNFADLFLHYGFNRSGFPESLPRDMDNLMELECSAVSEGVHVKVTAPLIGKDLFVSRTGL